MIKLLTDDRIQDFENFCSDKLSGAVLLTRLRAYGTATQGIMFWYSHRDDGTINGAFGLSDGIFLACADRDTSEEEIELFASIVGADTVSYGNAPFVLKYKKLQSGQTADDITGENVRDIFSVIFEEDKNAESFFAGWYTDVSHKIRHGLIHGKCIYENGRCVAAALTSGETQKLCVISSVAVLKAYRHKGYGKRVVLSLAGSLDKDVYLMTDSTLTREWYINMGFEEAKP